MKVSMGMAITQSHAHISARTLLAPGSVNTHRIGAKVQTAVILRPCLNVFMASSLPLLYQRGLCLRDFWFLIFAWFYSAFLENLTAKLYSGYIPGVAVLLFKVR